MKLSRAGILSALLAFAVSFGLAFGQDESSIDSKIDSKVAAEVLPYAQMSQDSFNDAPTTSVPGWTRLKGDWKSFFKPSEINKIASSQFFAAVYQDRKGNITIAYRSTKTDYEFFHTDVPAGGGNVFKPRIEPPDQYIYAKQLAALVRQKYPNATITLTGHSLGGGLATYAAQQAPGIAKVVTFNGVRAPILSTATAGGVNQLNVIVRGDRVGDPKSGSIAGLGSLPGKTYIVESTTNVKQNSLSRLQGRWDTAALDTHSLSGIIGGLQNVASSKKRPADAPAHGKVAGTPEAKSETIPTNKQSALLPKPAGDNVASAQPPVSRSPQSLSSRPSASGGRSVTVTPGSGSYPPRNISAFARPGGISLSQAAAAAMPIDIDLEGIHYRNGRLIISGRTNSSQVLDAALVLTALRASCEADDPYFSLDPDNGPAWSTESQSATERLWQHIKKDVGWDTPANADRKSLRSRPLFVRTIWGRRDYPQVWNAIASDYPNLKARLVFHPAWLQQTRFGEILYKADVLLKELSSGVSILEPGPVRAAKVNTYVSQLSRTNAEILFASLHDQKIETRWKGSRYWFDIAPPESSSITAADSSPIRSASDRELFNALKERKLVATGSVARRPAHHVAKNNETLDLSNVFPTMFVRRHDISRDIDIPDDDPIMNSLSTDVNNNVENYVNAYKELQALTEIVRAYIAAVHVVNANNSICNEITSLPLLESEKTMQALPTFHPSEIMMSVQRYVLGSGQTLVARAAVVQGGVSIAGKQFYDASTIGAETPVIASLRSELATVPNLEAINPSWEDNSGRQFIVLKLRDGHEVTRTSEPSSVPRSSATGSNAITDEIEIENEPPAAQLPWWKKWLEKRN